MSPSSAFHISDSPNGRQKSPSTSMDILAGITLESRCVLNAANATGISGSSEETTSPGVQEEGEARSPREKIRANRPLATTLRASGRSSAPSLIEAANDAVRLKHSNAEAGPKGREPDLKCHYGAIHIPSWKRFSRYCSG